MSIKTQYYRTMPDPQFNECAEEPYFNYDSYKLFCLKSKLAPVIRSLISSDVNIMTISERENDRMYINIKITNGDDAITLTDKQTSTLKTYIDKITGEQDDQSCLILSVDKTVNNYEGELLPLNWYKSMLPYLTFDDKYDIFFNEIGLCANLSEYPDYLQIYNNLTVEFINQLRDRYIRGYVMYAEPIRDKWDLEVVDDDSIIFRPLWRDNRFAPNLVDFLQSRLYGDEYINIEIGNSYVIRHFVAVKLLGLNGIDIGDCDSLTCNLLKGEVIDFMFVGPKVLVRAPDLNSAKVFTSIIMSALLDAQGKVVTVHMASSDDSNAYNSILKEIRPNYVNNVVVYKGDNQIYKYVYSVRVNDNENIEYLTNYLISQR